MAQATEPMLPPNSTARRVSCGTRSAWNTSRTQKVSAASNVAPGMRTHVEAYLTHRRHVMGETLGDFYMGVTRYPVK